MGNTDFIKKIAPDAQNNKAKAAVAKGKGE